jgi:hypothetical protein
VLLAFVVLGAGVTASAFLYPSQAKPTEEKSDKAIPGKPGPKDAARAGADRKAAAPPVADMADRIKPGDVLNIRSAETLPNEPIEGLFQVEASGKVALGATYGRVQIKGMTLEEAEDAIRKRLETFLPGPRVSLTRRVALSAVEGREELEGRVLRLEKEVRELRASVEELRRKSGAGR